MSQENKRQQKLNDRQILVATTSAPAPYRWSEYLITFTQVDQCLNFDHPGKYPLLVDSVIQESRVNKVLVDGGSSINITFPRTLLGLGVSLKELHESDTPFFSIVPTEGEYRPALTHLHACYLWNSGKLQNRVPEVRGGELQLRIQCHHRQARIGEIHGHSALFVHDIEDVETIRDHHCAR
jgi:hypothetical protein